MDKETLSNYGWIVICTLVLAVMIALATPFGEYVKDAVWSTTNGLNDTLNKNMEIVGLNGSNGGDNNDNNTQEPPVIAGEKYICIEGTYSYYYYDDFFIFYEDGSGAMGEMRYDECHTFFPKGYFTYTDTEIISDGYVMNVLEDGQKILVIDVEEDTYRVLVHESQIDWVDETVDVDGYATFKDGTTLTWTELKEKYFRVSNNMIYDYAINSDDLVTLKIPSSVKYIGEAGVYHCDALEEVIISEGMKYIGNISFAYNKSLASITIPDSVTNISWTAFRGCTSLADITLGNGLTSISSNFLSDTAYYNNDANWENGVLYVDNYLIEADTSLSGNYTIKNGTKCIADNAFYNCKSLASITIPSSVTNIGNNAFCYCTSLSNITIPNSVTTIGSGSFGYCSSLTNIAIPNSVTSIGNSAFYCCTSLSNITIPNGVMTIGSDSFEGCTSLKNITFGNNISYIGNTAFKECTSLKSITIPSSVRYISDDCFADCTSLESISIPEGVRYIGEYAFEGCTSLTDITIPNNVTHIYTNTFDNTAYYNDDANWENDSLYINNYLIAVKDPVGEYIIKDGTKCIAIGTFEDCASLTKVTIPNGITSIGKYAFYYCESLENITIPDSVTYIGRSAFGHCDSLTNVIIPNSITSIGDCAFYSCNNLISITIPDTVTYIGEQTFCFCDSLETVYYGGTMEQWNGIMKGDQWNASTNLTKAVCSDGTVSIPLCSYEK